MLLLPSPLLLLILALPFPSPAIHITWTGYGNLFGTRTNAGRNETQADPVAQGLFTAQSAVGVRKMTSDEDEMFFPDYWSFAPADVERLSDPSLSRRIPRRYGQDFRDGEGDPGNWMNATTSPSLQAPFALHALYTQESSSAVPHYLRYPRAIFAMSKRDFRCPDDTSACTGIDRPNSCCPREAICQIITDSGSGDVGCCSQGQTCSQEVTQCQDGYASCPGSQGGGCCMPGYACVDVGCEVSSTATVIVNPTVTAPPSTSSTSSSSSTSPLPAVTSVATSTETDTTVQTSTVISSLSSSRSSTPSTPSPTTNTSSRTPAAVAPVRPTSGTPSTSTTTTITPSQCPTGFYACSAHYHGGCCRVGRDCSSTSCPAASSTVALNSNGVIVNVPVSTTGAALGEGGCAQGWFNCGDAGGGGCCPSGYVCGESCTATGVNIGGGVTGTATVAKDNGCGRFGDGKSGVWVIAMVLSTVMAVRFA